MSDERIKSQGNSYRKKMNVVYSPALNQFYDLVSRNDFYGLVGEMTVRSFAEKMHLAGDSCILDLCCGTGGPARLFAQSYGCRVTGVDISEANYQVAQQRTKEAGLDALVRFELGDALTFPIAKGSYSHVFGCDSWSYFGDKAPLYQKAAEALRGGGTIAFMDHSCKAPLRFQYEKFLGSLYYESLSDYASLLKNAGFANVQHYDLSDLACKDFSLMLHTMIGRRDQLIKTFTHEIYLMALEIWAEAIANLGVGNVRYYGFIAEKE